MHGLLFVSLAVLAWINVLVSGAIPPRGQLHNPELMGLIVHQGLFPDKPKNMTFLEYFRGFTDVNEDLAKLLQKLEFNVLDTENLDSVIKLAEDVRRLKEIKMATLEAKRAKLVPENARRAGTYSSNYVNSENVFNNRNLSSAWTSETRRKLIQFMQHSVYSTRYEINKLRNLRKRYENSTVYQIGVIYGNQLELKVTAANLFSTMYRMDPSVTLLWFVFHYTKLLNIAQDIASNTEHIYLLDQRIKAGYKHRAWYRGEVYESDGTYYSMPTDSIEATTLDPDNLYRKWKKK